MALVGGASANNFLPRKCFVITPDSLWGPKVADRKVTKKNVKDAASRALREVPKRSKDPSCNHVRVIVQPFWRSGPFLWAVWRKKLQKKWTEANSSKLRQKKANANKYGPTAAKCTLYVFSVLLDICAVLVDLALLRFPWLQKVPETCPGCSRTSCDDHSSISSRGRRNGGVAI